MKNTAKVKENNLFSTLLYWYAFHHLFNVTDDIQATHSSEQSLKWVAGWIPASIMLWNSSEKGWDFRKESRMPSCEANHMISCFLHMAMLHLLAWCQPLSSERRSGDINVVTRFGSLIKEKITRERKRNWLAANVFLAKITMIWTSSSIAQR